MLLSERNTIRDKETKTLQNTCDQVAVLARVVSYLVANTGHPATFATTSTSSNHTLVEQLPIQVLVTTPI
jgi:hypothetical protein